MRETNPPSSSRLQPGLLSATLVPLGASEVNLKSYISERPSSIPTTGYWVHAYNNPGFATTPSQRQEQFLNNSIWRPKVKSGIPGSTDVQYHRIRRADEIDWSKRRHLHHIICKPLFWDEQLGWIACLPTYSSLSEVYDMWLAQDDRLDLEDLERQYRTVLAIANQITAFTKDKKDVHMYLLSKPVVDHQATLAVFQQLEVGLGSPEDAIMTVFGVFLKLLGWCTYSRHVISYQFQHYHAALQGMIQAVFTKSLSAQKITARRFVELWHQRPDQLEHVGTIFSKETDNMLVEKLIELRLRAWDLFVIESPSQTPVFTRSNGAGLPPTFAPDLRVVKDSPAIARLREIAAQTVGRLPPRFKTSVGRQPSNSEFDTFASLGSPDLLADLDEPDPLAAMSESSTPVPISRRFPLKPIQSPSSSVSVSTKSPALSRPSPPTDNTISSQKIGTNDYPGGRVWFSPAAPNGTSAPGAPLVESIAEREYPSIRFFMEFGPD